MIFIIRRRRQVKLRDIEINDQNRNINVVRNDPPYGVPVGFDPGLNFIGDSLCSIDLVGFSRGEMVILTPCHHIFHPECILEWMNRDISEKRCPNCNNSLAHINFQLK